MKISDLKVSFNSETFTPEMVMTLTISIETLEDGSFYPREEIATILGTELLNQIEEQLRAKS
jgi:hypothetical protein